MAAYKLRDLPLSIGDVIDVEAFQETQKIGAVKHLIDRFVIYEPGQSIRDIPIAELSVILEAILIRQGTKEAELKKLAGA
jgi:hypothetical protein